MHAPYDFEVTRIDGSSCRLEAWRGRTLLIVNVASRCGFTPQYAGLEQLYQRYRDRGLVVCGFPCDQFGHQEPGSDAEILRFCTEAYGVSFPLFRKIAVNGPQAHPLFTWLKRAKRGLLGSTAIKWNFTKFLVSRRGEVLKRFAPMDRPERLARHIESALQDTDQIAR